MVPLTIHIEPGSTRDYRVLERFHYRPGPPASFSLVLRAVRAGELIGVLVVSRPTLNGPWRARAFGDDFSAPAADAARLINARIRCISRVIVDPRFRAQGVAAALVRAYLARPLTIHTEALASMGRACPFFARAGMRALCPASSRRDRAFRAALARAGAVPWQLMDVRGAAGILRRAPALRKAARRWANDSRATRGKRPLLHLAILASARVFAPPIVYVSTGASQ